MRVLTLDEKDFRRHCFLLVSQVRDMGFSADAIVGIASGGVFVGKEMAEVMKLPLFEMTLQRPTTKGKKRLLPGLLCRLPRWMNDGLRIVESAFMSVSSRLTKSGSRLVPVDVPDGLRNFVSGHPEAVILVVDDAVDSGRTLRSVVSELQRSFPDATVRSAVITVTTGEAADLADVCLYENGTLVRFPWSIDA